MTAAAFHRHHVYGCEGGWAKRYLEGRTFVNSFTVTLTADEHRRVHVALRALGLDSIDKALDAGMSRAEYIAARFSFHAERGLLLS